MVDQPAVRQVSFQIEPWDEMGGRELVPYVDNVPFLDLVATYERAARFDVAGQYAGLVLDNFNYGDLGEYLTGESRNGFGGKPGTIALLGCDCGESACWPLLAQVVTNNDFVIWRDFTQPHRPKRDYTPFGPFTFTRPRYLKAIRTLTEQLD